MAWFESTGLSPCLHFYVGKEVINMFKKAISIFSIVLIVLQILNSLTNFLDFVDKKKNSRATNAVVRIIIVEI